MATATRAAYGKLLETELYKNEDIVVLDADLAMQRNRLPSRRLRRNVIWIWVFRKQI